MSMMTTHGGGGVTILASLEVVDPVTGRTRRQTFESLEDVRTHLEGIVREYRAAVDSRKAAQLLERDLALKLGQVLVQLRAQVPEGRWLQLYASLQIHRKKAQRCMRLAAVAGSDGRLNPAKLDDARQAKLAAMNARAREHWAAQALFTKPADELGHFEVCQVLGIRALPGLAFGEPDRVPVAATTPGTGGQGTTVVPCDDLADADDDGDGHEDGEEEAVGDAACLNVIGPGGGASQPRDSGMTFFDESDEVTDEQLAAMTQRRSVLGGRRIAVASIDIPAGWGGSRAQQLEFAARYQAAARMRSRMARVLEGVESGRIVAAEGAMERFEAGFNKLVEELEQTAAAIEPGAVLRHPGGREPTADAEA